MHFRSILLLLAFVIAPRSFAAGADADADIRDVLATQADAWNKGDLNTFIQSYAENCTFMGKSIVHSREKVLDGYRKGYPNVAAMGKLTFTNLDIRELGEHVAIATGSYHLDRTAQAGGNANGYFSLVLKDVDDDWQIVLDHTTELPPSAPAK